MFEREEIDGALERFREQQALLYDEDGNRLWSDQEHERRYRELLAEFDRTREAIVERADKRIEEANKTLALEHQDPAHQVHRLRGILGGAREAGQAKVLRAAPFEGALEL